MIKLNEYFDGHVKSLGFELDGTPYTVGVILAGDLHVQYGKNRTPPNRRRRNRHQTCRQVMGKHLKRAM